MNTTFTDGTTVVVAEWLNDVNDTVYDILGDGTNPPTDKAALLANLGGATLTDVTDAIDGAIGVTTQAYSANLDEFATVNPTVAGLALLDDADAAAQRTTLGLGTAATKDTGTSADNVVVLDGSAKLPAVDGSQLTNLPSTSFPTQTGNAGKVLKTDGTNVSWDSPLNSGTVINTTSGTAHDFTGIPSGVSSVRLLFNQVSTNGVSPVQVQVGSGSIVTTGYVTGASIISASVITANYTSGLVSNLESSGASILARVGEVVFTKVSGNIWVGSCILAAGSQPYTGVSSTVVTLSGALDRIRVTTINGTDVFDNGSINILYE